MQINPWLRRTARPRPSPERTRGRQPVPAGAGGGYFARVTIFRRHARCCCRRSPGTGRLDSGRIRASRVRVDRRCQAYPQTTNPAGAGSGLAL